MVETSTGGHLPGGAGNRGYKAFRSTGKYSQESPPFARCRRQAGWKVFQEKDIRKGTVSGGEMHRPLCRERGYATRKKGVKDVGISQFRS